MAPSRNFVQNNDKFDLDDILLSVPTDLNTCQQLAYLAAARHKAVLIAGGAGVGKSYVVGKIACLYADHGYRVALAAPTGKAAKRIEQIVDMPAQTVHRLLKYNGHEFARNEDYDTEKALYRLLQKSHTKEDFVRWVSNSSNGGTICQTSSRCRWLQHRSLCFHGA